MVYSLVSHTAMDETKIHRIRQMPLRLGAALANL